MCLRARNVHCMAVYNIGDIHDTRDFDGTRTEGQSVCLYSLTSELKFA